MRAFEDEGPESRFCLATPTDADAFSLPINRFFHRDILNTQLSGRLHHLDGVLQNCHEASLHHAADALKPVTPSGEVGAFTHRAEDGVLKSPAFFEAALREMKPSNSWSASRDPRSKRSPSWGRVGLQL
ncbi:hypothetical protein EYF80_028782 [Liparis tanakae]|uniref:Uncharacterized protein n=1 Tax=Liparis tanakae TaxID=230148 RepID=A0A4Z2H827_9TELE|nr:hypothetical protein EYF80_028782 [Liparis tanakae]